jgi:hypothetical protein
MGTAAAVAVAIASLYFLCTGSKRRGTKATNEAGSKARPNPQMDPVPSAIQTSSQDGKQYEQGT